MSEDSGASPERAVAVRSGSILTWSATALLGLVVVVALVPDAVPRGALTEFAVPFAGSVVTLLVLAYVFLGVRRTGR